MIVLCMVTFRAKTPHKPPRCITGFAFSCTLRTREFFCMRMLMHIHHRHHGHDHCQDHDPSKKLLHCYFSFLFDFHNRSYRTRNGHSRFSPLFRKGRKAFWIFCATSCLRDGQPHRHRYSPANGLPPPSEMRSLVALAKTASTLCPERSMHPAQ